MQVWNALHAARCKCRTQKSRQKSPFWHHPTTLSGYVFATKACIDNRKNLLNSDTSSTCPHNMVNFGVLMAETCWRVWGTPAHFNGFRVLAALLHGTLVVGVSQTAALNRGCHLYSAGRPWRWALAHILVCVCFMCENKGDDFTPNGPENSYTLRNAFFGNSAQLRRLGSVHLSSVSTDYSFYSLAFFFAAFKTHL